MSTATVHDFAPNQFRHKYARPAGPQTDGEPQDVTDAFTDMADGVLALDFALTFARFDHQARKFVLSIVGLLGDSQKPLAAFDEELAKHLGCNERTIQRWRKDYLAAAKVKQFGFIKITEGEYCAETKRYLATEYSLIDEVKEFVNNAVSEARESPGYAEDRHTCFERIAKANYLLIPNAPPIKRKKKPSTVPVEQMDRALTRAQKNVEQWRLAVRDIPKGQRAVLLASVEGERQRAILLQLQQEIADSLALFPANVDTEQVDYVPDILSGTPLDVSGAPDRDETTVRVKEEDTRTQEQVAEAQEIWHGIEARLNSPAVRTVEIPIFDDLPDEQITEPPEIVYEIDSDELAEREAIEAEANGLLDEPPKPRFEVGALVIPVNTDGAPLHNEPSPIAEARLTSEGKWQYRMEGFTEWRDERLYAQRE